MHLPDAAERPCKADNTMVKALARAFRWKRMLEWGDYATIAELAEGEGIAYSYMTRVLRLTLLAPDIVEAILDGREVRLRLTDLGSRSPSHDSCRAKIFLCRLKTAFRAIDSPDVIT